MNYEKLLDKYFELLRENEDRYCELSFKEMGRNNAAGVSAMTAQAAGWAGARYLLEDLMEHMKDDED